MLLLALTISQAASILGISTTASKAEINAAYREAITKYHPDANRSKSPEEQKKAEQMFKQVGVARKVMLNPQTAAPEPSATQTSSSYAQTGTRSSTSAQNAYNAQVQRQEQARAAAQAQQQGRTQQSYQASAASSKYSPQGYNTARSFNNDNIPKVVDPAEEEIANIYRDETYKQYVKFADKIRLTPSWSISILFLVISVMMFFTMPFDITNLTASLSTLSPLSNPCILIALISLVKILFYDTFISYYIYKAISKATKNAWGILCGIELIIMAITSLVLTMGSPLVPPFASLLFGGCIACGILIVVLSIVIAKARNKSKDKKK